MFIKILSVVPDHDQLVLIPEGDSPTLPSIGFRKSVIGSTANIINRPICLSESRHKNKENDELRILVRSYDGD